MERVPTKDSHGIRIQPNYLENSDRKRLVGALQEIIGPNLISVSLFGSRARGEARSFSDWDVFVLAENLPEDMYERGIFLRGELFARRVLKTSVLALTRKEFESDMRPIYLDIARDGIILYDTDGYTAGKFKEIEMIIEDLGLYRVKKRGYWVWEWKVPPKPLGNWELKWRNK